MNFMLYNQKGPGLLVDEYYVSVFMTQFNLKINYIKLSALQKIHTNIAECVQYSFKFIANIKSNSKINAII